MALPQRRLMCVLAHPDDESLETGGTLAKYAGEGVATYLVTATRGERGRYFEGKESLQIVGRTREAELRAAARELGIREVSFLDYEDGTLDRANPAEAIQKLDGTVRKPSPWPDWMLTTVLDTGGVWPTVWRAISCHKTQMSIYKRLESLSDDDHCALWGTQEFYRVFSLVNGGRTREADLFEGLP
jgi:LmbE family N-acetylglucosaminyl deacetylase